MNVNVDTKSTEVEAKYAHNVGVENSGLRVHGKAKIEEEGINIQREIAENLISSVTRTEISEALRRARKM